LYIRSRYAYDTHQSTGASPEANSERTPLIEVTRPNRKKRPQLSHRSVIALCSVLFLGILFGVIGACINQSLGENILDPDVRERIQRKWNIKIKEHRRFMEHAHEEEDQWKGKMDEWNEKQEDWFRKEQQWQREWTEMQRRAREEAERARKEKWDREHMNLYWEDIRPEEKCIAHRTKKYSARLANLLPGIDALDACKATSLTLHGVTYDSPLYCEDRVSN
jgi:hypothetical protein